MLGGGVFVTVLGWVVGCVLVLFLCWWGLCFVLECAVVFLGGGCLFCRGGFFGWRAGCFLLRGWFVLVAGLVVLQHIVCASGSCGWAGLVRQRHSAAPPLALAGIADSVSRAADSPPTQGQVIIG